jgi:hypothetical protein
VEQFRQTLDELIQTKHTHVGAVDEHVRKAQKIIGEVRKCHRDAKDCHMSKLQDLKGALQDSAVHTAAVSGRNIVGFSMGSGDAKRQKLDSMQHDVSELIEKAKHLNTLMSGSLEPLEENFEKTFSGLERTVRDLSQLPVEARRLQAAASDMASMAKLDISSLRNFTELKGIRETAAGLHGMVDTIAEVLTAAENLLAGIDVFLQSAPDRLRDAFALPFPFCCCDFALDEAASILNALIESLNERLVEPLANALRSMLHLLSELDFARMISPFEVFASEANVLIDLLEAIQRASYVTYTAVECVKSHCCVCGRGHAVVASA